jgi:hypothetical protein
MFISGSLDDLVNLLCDTYYADGKIFSLFAASVAIYMEELMKGNKKVKVDKKNINSVIDNLINDIVENYEGNNNGPEQVSGDDKVRPKK